MLCDTPHEESKVVRLVETESRMVVAMGWEKGSGELLIKGAHFW